jgi:cytidyltransferase-related domain
MKGSAELRKLWMRQLLKERKATIVAGTFSYLHAGHRQLLERAFSSGNPMIVGLTVDEYATKNQKYNPPSFEARKEALEAFLNTMSSDFTIVELNSVQGDSATNPYYENIAVSRETLNSALNINKKRISTGLTPLNILVADSVIAKDYMIISSSRISSGEIDTDGNRITPLQISLSFGHSFSYTDVGKALGKLFRTVPLKIVKRHDIGLFSNEFDVRRFTLGNIGTCDYSIFTREKLVPGSEFVECAIIVESGILDRNGYFTLGYSSSIPLNMRQYNAMQRSETSDPAVQWLDGYTTGRLIRESLISAMYPRRYPWAFDMMGFHSTL